MLNEMQCTTGKNRCPLDHIAMLNAIIENQRYKSEKPMYSLAMLRYVSTSCGWRII